MKSIKNESLQGLEIYLNTPKGAITTWLTPRAVITVPNSYITEQVKVLAKRRMLKVF